ncbi:hypothetical protein EVAR_4620_1 [Eumeta japonica]|uniref:Uncharacterized protein n=1 Tax=Eumeta variegata TaxID=151549 RepID=A0A4C1SZ10_EUMVA|nr:hypothetical protein EVAR_4620_1 [Eumeta japonica]
MAHTFAISPPPPGALLSPRPIQLFSPSSNVGDFIWTAVYISFGSSGKRSRIFYFVSTRLDIEPSAIADGRRRRRYGITCSPRHRKVCQSVDSRFDTSWCEGKSRTMAPPPIVAA